MPIRETDPDFESELFEEAKKVLEERVGIFKYWLPLPLLLVDEDAEKQLPCHKNLLKRQPLSVHMCRRASIPYSTSWLSPITGSGIDQPISTSILRSSRSFSIQRGQVAIIAGIIRDACTFKTLEYCQIWPS